MIQRFAPNRGTCFVDALVGDFLAPSYDGVATYGALFWKFKNFLFAGSQLGNYLFYIRNHITGTANDDRVPYFDAEPFDLVFIVERGARYGRAADLNRLQNRDRRQRAGTTDGNNNIFEDCGRFARRKFVGDRPTVRFTNCAKLAKHDVVINLDDNAVNFIVKDRKST